MSAKMADSPIKQKDSKTMKAMNPIIASIVALCSAMVVVATPEPSRTFAAFADHSWVTGEGTVTRILEDDLVPPCHQRFILADDAGRTILVAHNIDGWPRLANISTGDRVAFCGEFISNEHGGLVHWTHPDPSGIRPSGWIRRIENDTPETSWWLSTNSNVRHNSKCENYRRTRGRPCAKTEGRPCGKCGG